VAIQDLGTRLVQFWERYSACFRTTTRDSSDDALDYRSGLLRLKEERNFTNLAKASGQSPQNLQHFMTYSPWQAQEVLIQVRQEIAATPALARGGVILLDESAEEKASAQTVGAARQHNGRLGQVEMSQVGTFLAYVHEGIWTWIDGELFLPKSWFDKKRAAERARLGVPPDRRFATKIELGWKMIQRVTAEGLPFEGVCFDTLYGRSRWLRRQVDQAGLIYLADVPANTEVFLRKPVVGVPAQEEPQRGRPYTKPRVLSAEKPVEVRELAVKSDAVWTRVRVRQTERGELQEEFSARRVWTSHPGEEPVEEWLVMRRASEGKLHYGLSNASADTGLERLAWGKCQRHFVECCNQEAKSQIGWDELRAQKYPAWEHHLALTILASWFMAQTRLEWRQQYPRPEALKQVLGVDALPAWSLANLRELLRAVLPLPQLSIEYATNLVVEHLVNRTRSRKSRMKRRGHKHSPT
jgi:SRSO17 transposase